MFIARSNCTKASSGGDPVAPDGGNPGAEGREGARDEGLKEGGSEANDTGGGP